jgi:uncharacterized protein YndB with AHSA1/START domain
VSIVSVDKDYDQLSLTLVAEFDAPIERVWELWADPRRLERWWGPPTHPATVEEHDLSAGGAVAYFMTGPQGESRGWWRVTAVDAPRSLDFTDGYANRDGTPNADTPTTAVRVRLAEKDGGGTRMELRFAFASSEHMEQLERLGAFDVFPQSVGQMDALLS